jgi:hypothetical protein
MTAKRISLVLFFIAISASSVPAYCPLDHLFIGCNKDGIEDTPDDMKLFIDCRHKYRSVDSQGNWYYSLNQSGFDPCDYIINEPGLDEINDGSQSDHPLKDPDRSLEGTRNQDYRIMYRCVSISDNFTVTDLAGDIEITQPGDEFNISDQGATHFHLWYTYSNDSPDEPAPDKPLWVTFEVYDALGKYQSSENVTIVFASDPLAGDLVFDNKIDFADLMRFQELWLNSNGSENNDYYERADIDQNGIVDINDYAQLAGNWLTEL